MVECHLEAGVTVIRGEYRIAVVGQRPLEHVEHLAAILDDEHCRCWTFGRGHAGTLWLAAFAASGLSPNPPARRGFGQLVRRDESP